MECTQHEANYATIRLDPGAAMIWKRGGDGRFMRFGVLVSAGARGAEDESSEDLAASRTLG